MNFNSHHNKHGRPNIPTPGGFCPSPPSAFPSDHHHHMPPHFDFCPPPPPSHH